MTSNYVDYIIHITANSPYIVSPPKGELTVLLAIDLQMASIAQAVIEAGQKSKNAREQLEALESNKKTVNRRRKQLLTSASEPRNMKQGVPVQDVADNVVAISNTVNCKNAEEHTNKGQRKFPLNISILQVVVSQSLQTVKSVTKEVTSKK